MAALCALSAAIGVLALGSGAVAISPADVLAILGDALGIHPRADADPQASIVLLAIRLPRLLAGFAIGAALAVAGAAIQGLFRNPLADPALIGVSSGAAVGAVATIVLAGTILEPLGAGRVAWALPASAFAAGLFATWTIARIASNNGALDVTTMLLAGIAINAMAGAVIGILILLSDDRQLREATFWMLGSLASITWHGLVPVLPLLLLPLMLLPLLARALNALLLGEVDAYLLGIRVERTKWLVVVLAALATGAAVAVAGIIGFIGLVAPHLARLCIGVDHRLVLPASALLGGSLLVLSDLIARTIVLPAELPIGIVTSLLGGPFFLWLLVRRRPTVA